METIEKNILDVTVLDPRLKHPTIFKRFDGLEESESLTIHNDHDPKPLYYQLLNERGKIFQWEYLEEGPVWWKVRITKRSPSDNNETVGEIAAQDLRKAQVFKKYGIDFCCGGKKTVSEVCSEKGLDIVQIEKELRDVTQALPQRSLSYNEWKLDFLIDYIVNMHHAYVRTSLPQLRQYAAKCAQVHGERHSELHLVEQTVESINEEMTEHMMKEEKILFPYVKYLQEVSAGNQRLKESHFGSVSNPIIMMEIEHDNAGKLLAEIRKATANYTLPADACASYSMLYNMLVEFENDLHIHIHLENNILFPKAIALERQLMEN